MFTAKIHSGFYATINGVDFDYEDLYYFVHDVLEAIVERYSFEIDDDLVFFLKKVGSEMNNLREYNTYEFLTSLFVLSVENSSSPEHVGDGIMDYFKENAKNNLEYYNEVATTFAHLVYHLF